VFVCVCAGEGIGLTIPMPILYAIVLGGLAFFAYIAYALRKTLKEKEDIKSTHPPLCENQGLYIFLPIFMCKLLLIAQFSVFVFVTKEDNPEIFITVTVVFCTVRAPPHC